VPTGGGVSKVIRIGDVSIPLDSYVVGGTALLGIRESGKTYAAKGIAEQLLDYKVPIVVFDAIGVWRHLKVARPTDGGRGFKVVIAGGESPDLPLTPASAPAIVRAAIAENIPLVIDLYDSKLSKADWRRIVQHCFRTLLYENKGLRHIFLEETAEYAPQKVMDGETYAEVEKLVRMGGNKSLGITLINQRAQEVNKAVLDLCENLVLMRQRGAHAIGALEKWIDKLEPDVAKKIAAEMPRMGQGDAWVFSGSADAAKRTHTALILSYHPDRRKPQAKETSPDRIADTADFVSKLTGELKVLTIQAEANDPKMLRKRIADLEQQLRGKPGAVPAMSREDLRAAEQRGFQRGHEAGAQELSKVAAQFFKRLKGSLHQAIEKTLETTPIVLNSRASPAPPVARVAPERQQSAPAPRRSSGNGHAASGEQLPTALRKFLTVLAQRQGRSTTRNQVAIFSGYSTKSRHVDNTLAALRSAGYAEGGGDDIRITSAGLAALGSFDELPSSDALRDYWLRNAGGAAAAAMLRVIFEVYPKTLTRNEVANLSNYSPESRHVDNTLARLRSLDLISGPGSAIVASEDLFS
jgi:hypothetical protein